MKETEHKYWCGGCEGAFILEGIVKVCPKCGDKKFGIDEPIIKTPTKVRISPQDK